MTIINQRWGGPCPRTCEFGRVRFDVHQESSRSRVRTTVRRGRPLWRARLTWERIACHRGDSSDMAELRWWLEQLDGGVGSVQLWDFNHPCVSGTGRLADGTEMETGTLQWSGSTGGLFPWLGPDNTEYFWSSITGPTAGAGLAGATQFDVSGLYPSETIAKRGDYIQIGRRLYVLSASLTSDAAGEATVYLTTPLLADVSAGDLVIMTEAACEMHLTQLDWTEQGEAGNPFVSVTAEFMETATDYA